MTLPPTHPNHTFLGYRGVSRNHFRMKENRSIEYILPPSAVEGGAQLGAGVYVTDLVEIALEYAQDSGWNMYCNAFRSKVGRVEDGDQARAFQSTGEWRKWGRVHAVFFPDDKLSRLGSADFTHIDPDRIGEWVVGNIGHFVKRNRSTRFGATTIHKQGSQTIIYPPHTSALYVTDITDTVR